MKRSYKSRNFGNKKIRSLVKSIKKKKSKKIVNRDSKQFFEHLEKKRHQKNLEKHLGTSAFNFMYEFGLSHKSERVEERDYADLIRYRYVVDTINELVEQKNYDDAAKLYDYALLDYSARNYKSRDKEVQEQMNGVKNILDKKFDKLGEIIDYNNNTKNQSDFL